MRKPPIPPLSRRSPPTALERIHHNFGETRNSQAALEMADHLRIRIAGFHHARVGAEWGSLGCAEGDCLHHINLVVASDAQVIHSSGVQCYQPGHAYWSPGNTPLVRECASHLETYFLIFRFEWFGGVDPFTEWPNRRPLALGPWTGTFDPRKWDLQRGLTMRDAWLLRAQIAIWLSDALPEMEDVLAIHKRMAARFRPAFEFLESHIGADLRVEDLASVMGLTSRAFSMAFTRALRLSPKAYLSRRLNQEAIARVLHSSLAMKQIADELRFSDEYHFNRFFKHMNGLPPLRYRARQLSLLLPPPSRKRATPAEAASRPFVGET